MKRKGNIKGITYWLNPTEKKVTKPYPNNIQNLLELEIEFIPKGWKINRNSVINNSKNNVVLKEKRFKEYILFKNLIISII